MNENTPDKTKSAGIAPDAKRLRLRISGVLAADAFIRGSSCGLLASGTVCIFARIFVSSFPVSGLIAFTALSGAAAGIIPALFSLCRAPAKNKCLAALDESSHAGGFFMMSAAPGAEKWKSPDTVMPRIAWDARRPCSVFLMALFFCAAVFALPRSIFTPARPPAHFEINSLVEAEAERAAVLKEEKLIPEQTADSLAEELERIGGTGDAADPANVLEALDHIAEDMQRTANEAAEKMTAELESVRAVSALSEMLGEAAKAGGLQDEQIKKAAAGLFEFASSLSLSPSVMSNLMSCVSGLVSRNIMIAEFKQEKQGLEDVFMNVTKGDLA